MLVDRFGRPQTYLRISVTDRCNLRCVYCMPEAGLDWKPREDLLTYEEIGRLAQLLVSMGVTKIRLTGGEPTLRQDLHHLLGYLGQLPGLQSLHMTTNGLTLADHAQTYRALGLHGVNVSLDTLKPHRYLAITRRPGFEQVMAGLEAAMSVGFEVIKLNVVVMAGVNDDELLDFVAFVKDKPLNVRFIEWMPFQQTPWNPHGILPYHTMRERIEAQYTLIPLPHDPSAVAKDFALAGGPDGLRGQGTVSFITSMTESFCEGCNRLRLTADGHVKVCLFEPVEIPLRELIREGASDAELAKVIQQAIWQKPQGHPPAVEIPAALNRPMVQIGG